MDNGVSVVICRDLEELSKKAAVRIAQYLADRAKVKERVAMVLSGGTTPRRLYERLAMGTVQLEIPWQQVHLFWGDERCVSPDDPASNYCMAYQSLISRIQIPPENIHRMPTEQPDPQQAADQYEAELRSFWRSPPTKWPQFDLVLLGIGTDGHTASLFPGSSVLQETKRWVVAPYLDHLKGHRLTLTLPVFNHADQVVFLAAGRDKAPIIQGLFSTSDQERQFPFRFIQPDHGTVMFFLDAPAAGLLDRSETG